MILAVTTTVGMLASSLSRNVAALPLPPAASAPATVAEAGPPAESAVVPIELPAEGQVRLRYGGQTGERWRYRATGRVSGTMAVMGQSLPLQVETTSGYTQEILAADGSKLTFRLTPDPLEVQQNGQPFAGALPPTPAPLTVTMDRRGRMQQVDQPGGGETVPVAGLPAGLALDQRAIVEQLSAAALPEQAVGVGDTWSHQVNVPLGLGGSMRISTRCRLDGYELLHGRRTARVVSEMSAPVTMNVADPRDEAGIAQSGRVSGTVTTWFDPARGVLVASDSDLHLDFTMKLADAPAAGAAVAGVPGLEQLLGGQGNLELKASGTIRQKVELDESGAGQ